MTLVVKVCHNTYAVIVKKNIMQEAKKATKAKNLKTVSLWAALQGFLECLQFTYRLN